MIGSGPVGVFFAIILKREGFDVEVYEKRKDPTKPENKEKGRSINLTLGERALAALDKIGLKEKVYQHGTKLHGRAIHELGKDVAFHNYGLPEQHTLCISRPGINELLINVARDDYKIPIHFEYELEDINHDE